MYFQQTTYNHDYNKSPRVGFGDNSPRGGYYQESPRGDPRDGPRGYPADFRYRDLYPRQPPPIEPGAPFFVDGTSRSPHHSPVPQRRQAPAESHRSYDRVSPQPLVGPESPRRYPYYDMAREDLPPINTYAINSTTQRDYGANVGDDPKFNARTTQKDYGEFSERQNLANDIRGRLDPELARRYDKKYDSRPYFDEQDPPSFYRDLALTDRSGYSVERRAPHFDHAPLTDRPERNRRSPPPPRHAFDDMAKGQMKKEMDKIELHDANFKPYSHHNHGGVEGDEQTEHDVRRNDDKLAKEEDADHAEHLSQTNSNNSEMAEGPRQRFVPYHAQNIQHHHENPRAVAHHQRLYEQERTGKLDPFPSLLPDGPGSPKKSPVKSQLQKQQVHSGPVAHHKRLYERPPSKNNKTAKQDEETNVDDKGPGVLSRPIEHHEHRYEDDLLKTTSPRRSQGAGVSSRQVEHHEYRFENDLLETYNPRRSQNAGVLPRHVEHYEHRFENNLQKTRNPHPKEGNLEPPDGLYCPDVLLRPEERRVIQKLPMHEFHRFEQVHKTDYPERLYSGETQGQMNPAGGVFLLIRTDDAGFHDIKRAFELFTGDTPQRKLLGLATADMIDVKQGGAGWKRQSVVARWNGQYYNQERRGPVDKLLAVNWFPTAEFAKEWIDRDREFKHSAFPMPYGNQTSVLQLKYQPSGAKNYRTYMMMEFNSITNRDQLNKYIDFLCKQLTRYQADIAFIDGPPVPIKSSILDPRAHVVCHRFSNKREADRFYNDVVEGRNFEHADVTTIVFSLLDIMKR